MDLIKKIPKEDYYANMYDIENLTHLNRKRKNVLLPKYVQDIGTLIRENRCVEAKKIIEQLIKDGKQDTELFVLMGAIKIKDILLEKGGISPKNSALKELSEYLHIPIKNVEKKMLVEIPVEEDWKRKNPDPRNEAEVTNFYMETDSYLYELMAANHIVQTLYSFYVLSEKLKNKQITKIIDYGAGAGTLCILFTKLGYEVVYADLPGKLFDYAKWRFEKRGLNIKMIDLKKENIANEECDAIISTEVVEHVVDPVGLLNIFKNKLKGGQYLIVSESCEYVEDFATHLESNRKYGGKNFIKLMTDLGFKQIEKSPFIPQLVFEKK